MKVKKTPKKNEMHALAKDHEFTDESQKVVDLIHFDFMRYAEMYPAMIFSEALLTVPKTKSQFYIWHDLAKEVEFNSTEFGEHAVRMVADLKVNP
jgi:hypothetical protein